MRIEEDPALDLAALAHARRLDPQRIEAAAIELRDRALIAETASGDGGAPRRALTAAGCEALDRLVAARRARLAELLADWDPEKREDLAAVLGRLSRELVPDAPRPVS